MQLTYSCAFSGTLVGLFAAALAGTHAESAPARVRIDSGSTLLRTSELVMSGQAKARPWRKTQKCSSSPPRPTLIIEAGRRSFRPDVFQVSSDLRSARSPSTH
jgi:hypothetical protein